MKLSPKPGWDDRVTVFLEHPILNFAEASSYVSGERTIDINPGQAVAGMAGLLELRSGIPHALEAGRVAFLPVEFDCPEGRTGRWWVAFHRWNLLEVRWLLAHCGWLLWWRLKQHPHLCEPLCPRGSVGPLATSGHCGRWVLLVSTYWTDIYHCCI